MIEFFNKEAEEAVLGSILLEGLSALDRARDVLTTEDFYTFQSRRIYDCMIELFNQKISFDIVTVFDSLGSDLDKIGGRQYILHLINSMPTAANLEHYAQIVKNKSLARAKIAQCDEIKKKLLEDEDPADVISQSMAADMKILNGSKKNEVVKIGPEVSKVYDSLDYQKENNGITGISTGFNSLYRIGGGLQKPSFNLLAARPSVGKTTFAMNIGKFVAYNLKVPVLMFSLEMSREQLARKYLALCAGINSKLFHNAKQITDEQWAKTAHGAGVSGDSEFYIDDTCNLKASEIWVRSRKFKSVHPDLGLIIIDYHQLMAGEHAKMSPVERVSESSRITRNIGRDLNVPVLDLSQLSRSVEQRENKVPLLSDLRESGSLEQDADTVIFLYREDYYSDDKSAPDPSETAVFIAKNRLEGGIGAVKLKYYKAKQKFEE